MCLNSRHISSDKKSQPQRHIRKSWWRRYSPLWGVWSAAHSCQGRTIAEAIVRESASEHTGRALTGPTAGSSGNQGANTSKAAYQRLLSYWENTARQAKDCAFPQRYPFSIRWLSWNACCRNVSRIETYFGSFLPWRMIRVIRTYAISKWCKYLMLQYQSQAIDF